MANLDGQMLVVPEELHNAAESLAKELADMQECFDKMRATMNASAGYWVGLAGDAHRSRYQEEVEMTEEMIRRYREHVTDLNEMAGVYTDAEQRAQATTDQLPTPDL